MYFQYRETNRDRLKFVQGYYRPNRLVQSKDIITEEYILYRIRILRSLARTKHWKIVRYYMPRPISMLGSYKTIIIVDDLAVIYCRSMYLLCTML